MLFINERSQAISGCIPLLWSFRMSCIKVLIVGLSGVESVTKELAFDMPYHTAEGIHGGESKVKEVTRKQTISPKVDHHPPLN